LHNNKTRKIKPTSELAETPFVVELTTETGQSYYDILLEAIDEGLSSLGESAKIAIYLHLENTFGIKKQEIPFRIDAFQEALEKLFGLGARHIEILFIKSLKVKVEVEYKWNMPSCIVPELTFQEYLRLVKMNFENSNTKTNE
jgi:hypothetical protein